jgi:hypothetical protein
MKGEATKYDFGITPFGTALMYSINQFACQESLSRIYCRVSFFQYLVDNSLMIVQLYYNHRPVV